MDLRSWPPASLRGLSAASAQATTPYTQPPYSISKVPGDFLEVPPARGHISGPMPSQPPPRPSSLP
jgi:hypothetical protein